jgi:hypothetical protein
LRFANFEYFHSFNNLFNHLSLEDSNERPSNAGRSIILLIKSGCATGNARTDFGLRHGHQVKGNNSRADRPQLLDFNLSIFYCVFLIFFRQVVCSTGAGIPPGSGR